MLSQTASASRSSSS
uniref:EMB2770 (EMBRYO DEFECTIVE 2770) n=1 Tax=Arundo donax TaxID=35708 RepID=A0A0A9HPI3_ARUDO